MHIDFFVNFCSIFARYNSFPHLLQQIWVCLVNQLSINIVLALCTDFAANPLLYVTVVIPHAQRGILTSSSIILSGARVRLEN